MRKVFFEKGPCSAFLLPQKTKPGQRVQKKELGIFVASRDGEKEEEKEEEASFRYFHDEKTSFFLKEGGRKRITFPPSIFPVTSRAARFVRTWM